MNRLASVLIVTAMGVIALSAAAVLRVLFDFTLGQSMILGGAVLFGLVFLQSHLQRARDRRWVETRIAEIAAVASDVNNDMARFGERILRFDSHLGERIRREGEPLAAEVEVLGSLLKQVTDALAETEQRLDRLERQVREQAEAVRAAPPVQIAATPPPAAAVPAPPAQTIPVAFAPPPPPPPAEPAPSGFGVALPERLPSAFEREVEAAIRAEQIEIHLQPVVSLPQRKVRLYEAQRILRTESGMTLPAGDFHGVAESARLLPRVDTFIVVRAFQILKRLHTRNREVGMLIGLSLPSIADNGFFREFQSFCAQNKPLAELVVFELSQDDVRRMGPIEQESVAAVADLGFRFAIGMLTDLRTDFHRLGTQGFRYARVSAGRLLSRAPGFVGDIDPVDLSGHLARQGIELIVDGIETEAQVLELLDFNIRFAQGNLFAAPRLVRPETLQGAPSAADQVRAAPAARTARG
ncbi:EAL domain-containing protein [Methylobrevis albus]|uniref:EAL domain-containing protein n=1 Tax=Methylobrevis albus TaxID=2793297 RepID=A0A931MZL1_9HYPH|nr:EAL domain-containing protein [Methylobrevis albus]MBH0238194.1 EAL domain-containing protein [Methylobrevis albus]